MLRRCGQKMNEEIEIEFKELRKIKWKTKMCHVGSKCWCRLIVSENGYIIIGDGRLSKEEAAYFIRLHNKSIGREKK